MGVAASDILKSSTYEIDLLLCGCVQTVPTGSYMQVGFGFPEGYGPEDAGATFKVYHYVYDENGNMTAEEVPCVVTEYGIIATVKSFSPYAIVAVKSSAIENATKNVYARTVGLGGSVSSSSQGIAQLKEGESVTYTFTPEDGYKVERVLLNGTATTVSGNSATFAYADLEDNNIIEVYFVANSVAEKEAAEGITPVYPSLKVYFPSAVTTTETSNGGMSGWLIAFIIIACLFVVAAIVAVIITAFRRVRD
jgi:hypothetical protein